METLLSFLQLEEAWLGSQRSTLRLHPKTKRRSLPPEDSPRRPWLPPSTHPSSLRTEAFLRYWTGLPGHEIQSPSEQRADDHSVAGDHSPSLELPDVLAQKEQGIASP
jgi:hypothetical protein